MTLSLAWVRTCTDSRELIVATDSRLTGGKKWDCAPKIFSLPRSDSLICFAGETNYAYPLMTQMASAIEQYPQSRSREMDITHMKGHTLRIWNRMIQEIEDLPSGYESANPNSVFVLSGYSWKQKKFYIWLLHYDNEISKYTYKPVRKWEGIDGYKKVAITGDRRLEAKDKLREILEEKGKLRKGGVGF